MRSILTMLGIIIGVSAIITIISIGDGTNAKFREQIGNEKKDQFSVNYKTEDYSDMDGKIPQACMKVYPKFLVCKKFIQM